MRLPATRSRRSSQDSWTMRHLVFRSSRVGEAGVWSGLVARTGVEDEGGVHALFWGAGLGSERGWQFGFGVALVAVQVDPDRRTVGGSLVAEAQDRCGLVVRSEEGRDVAELPAVVDERFAQVGPAALDVGADPLGDDGSGLLVWGVGHGPWCGDRPWCGQPSGEWPGRLGRDCVIR